MRVRCCLSGAGLLVLAMAVGLPAQERRRVPTPPSPPRSSSMPKLPAGPVQPTRLELAILELSCSTDVADKLDLGRLVAGNATPAVILERLQEYGEASAVFRVANEIDLVAGTEIVHGSRVPSVQDVVVNAGGQVTPSVTYEKVGTILKLRGQWREDDPQTADVTCKIQTSAVVDSLVQVASGVTLPVFSELNVEQAIPVRDGRPTCCIVSGMPLTNEKESVTHLYLLYLALARADKCVGSAPAAGPQTMIKTLIIEVQGDRDKLSRLDPGREPPADADKLQETLGKYGTARLVARPSLLAIWPCTSNVTMSWSQPMAKESADAGPERAASRREPLRVGDQRSQFILTIDGRWSDTDAQAGTVTMSLEARPDVQCTLSGPSVRESNPVVNGQAEIRDGAWMCFTSEVIAAEEGGQSRRYAVFLAAQRIDKPAPSCRPR